jgi:hypothetical protein
MLPWILAIRMDDELFWKAFCTMPITIRPGPRKSA